MGVTRDELIERLKNARRGELREAARKTRVAYSTIRSIRDGHTKNPGIGTFDKLASHFSQAAH